MKTFCVIPGQNIPQHYADCVWCLHQSVVLSRRWLTQSPLLDGVLGGFIPLTGEQLCLFSRSILWRVPLLWGFGDDLQGFLFFPLQPGCPLSQTPRVYPRRFTQTPGVSPQLPRCGTGQGQGAGLRVLQPGEAALGFGGDAVVRDGGCGTVLTVIVCLHPVRPWPVPPTAPQSPPRQRGRLWGCSSPHDAACPEQSPGSPGLRGPGYSFRFLLLF